MYRFLLAPRWLALHLTVLLVIPAFFFLGRWQWHRFEEHSALSELITANLAAPPVPLTDLDSPGAVVKPSVKYRKVTVTGTYDVSGERVVRRRTQNQKVGFNVVTPLRTEGGAVLVNRGWIPAGDTADSAPTVPPAPAGEVTVTGRLRPAETQDSTGIKDRQGLPPGQILLINDRTLAKTLAYPLYGGHIDLIDPAATSPEPVPAPDVGGGGGLNLAYAVQWWLFIGISVGGWVILMRREAHDLRAEAGREPEAVAAPVG